MNLLTTLLMVFIATVIGTIIIMPLVISLSKKLKLRQTILHYVESHAVKGGTPTFGGIGFIVVVCIVCLISFDKDSSLALVCMAVFLGYGIIGFLDDFIKIFFKRNKGLNVLQKIVAQFGLSIIVAIYAYSRADIGGDLWIPFFVGGVDIGRFIVPFNILLIIAITNAVNLVDGLDGLASKVSVVFLVATISLIFIAVYASNTLSQSLLLEYNNILIFCVALVGGIIGFLCFNGYPAKIFMGDTGALAIGGGIACIMIFSKLSLFFPLIGIMYTLTCISVLVQVGYYKLTKKRVFLMAPLHHHFEQKGMHENVIVTRYAIYSVLCCAICVLISLLVIMM